MKRVDREALRRAIKLARSHDAGRKQQIDTMLKDRTFEEVAMFAAYCCQRRALQLRPYQSPPCEANVDDEDDDGMGAKGGRRAAALLLQRLLDAKLSGWEPSPLEALARIEAKQAARP